MYVMHSSLFKFLIVGVLSTTINYATFALLLLGIHVAYILASVIGYVIGMVFGYVLNRRWSFSTTSGMSLTEVVLYGLVYMGSLGVNTLSLFALVEYGAVSPLVGNVSAITISTATNYLGLRYAVFGNYMNNATIVKSTTHE